jgi:hypothetical protein
MITVKINILTTEWEFIETLPFDVETIQELEEDFKLPLYDEEGEETDSVILPNCKILRLIGEDDEFLVVFEKTLITSWEKFNPEENTIEFIINLSALQSIWNQGEEIGVFYSWENLPQQLKEFKIG